MKKPNLEVATPYVKVSTLMLDEKHLTPSLFAQIQEECILDIAETQFELSDKEIGTIWGKVYLSHGRSSILTGFFILWEKDAELRRTFFSIPAQANQWVSLYYEGRLDRDAIEKYKKLYTKLNSLPQLFVGG